MSMSLKSVAVTAASWLVFAGLLQSAEEVAKPKPSSESAAALVSPEFAEHFDVDAAAAAFRADNAEALIALGEKDRKSTRLNSSHGKLSRMPSSA